MIELWPANDRCAIFPGKLSEVMSISRVVVILTYAYLGRHN